MPNVTGSDAPKGSWFAPNVEPEPIPGLNAPAEEPPPPPSPVKQDLADRLGSREPKRLRSRPSRPPSPKRSPRKAWSPTPVAESTQYIEVEQPEQSRRRSRRARSTSR